MITEAIKKVLAENVIRKILGFLFVIGIVPFLIIIYGLDEKPNWIEKEKHHLKNSYALTIKAPLELMDTQNSVKLLESKATTKFIKEIYDRALKQIKISYDWDNLDEPTKKLVIKNLNLFLSTYNFDFIKKQAIYEDKLNFEIYGLYSVDNADIDVTLQNLYEKINQKILESY